MRTRELECAAHRVESEIRIADAVQAIRTLVDSTNRDYRFDWDARWSAVAVPHGAIPAPLDTHYEMVRNSSGAGKKADAKHPVKGRSANVVSLDAWRKRTVVDKALSGIDDVPSGGDATGGRLLQFPCVFGRQSDSDAFEIPGVAEHTLTWAPISEGDMPPSENHQAGCPRLISTLMYRALGRTSGKDRLPALRARWGHLGRGATHVFGSTKSRSIANLIRWTTMQRL